MPWVSNEDYQQQVERITADLFTKNETFRQTIVYREMFGLALKGAAIIGAANLVALVGIYYGVYAVMERTIAEKATKAVTDRNEAVTKSIETITTTAINKVSEMQVKLVKAQETLDANEQNAKMLATRVEKLSTTVKMVTDNREFLENPENIRRTAAFAKMVQSNKEAKVITDMVDDLNYLRNEIDARLAQIAARFHDAPYRKIPIQLHPDVQFIDPEPFTSKLAKPQPTKK